MAGSVYFSNKDSLPIHLGHFVFNGVLSGSVFGAMASLGLGHVHPISAAIYGGIVSVIDQIFEREFRVSAQAPAQKMVYSVASRTIALIVTAKLGMVGGAALYLSTAAAVIPLAISIIASTIFLSVKYLGTKPKVDKFLNSQSRPYHHYVAYSGCLNSFEYKAEIKEVKEPAPAPQKKKVGQSGEPLADQETTGPKKANVVEKIFSKTIHIEHGLSLSAHQITYPQDKGEAIGVGPKGETLYKSGHYVRWNLFENISYELKAYAKVASTHSTNVSSYLTSPITMAGEPFFDPGNGLCFVAAKILTAVPQLFIKH